MQNAASYGKVSVDVILLYEAFLYVAELLDPKAEA
jgi:hypothetical protein